MKIISMVPRVEIENIRSVTDIVQVINEFVRLKETDFGWEGMVTDDEGKTSKIRVDKGANVFQDLASGVSGDVFEFLCRYSRPARSFRQAILDLANRAGLKLESQREYGNGITLLSRERLLEINTWALQYFHSNLINSEHMLSKLLAKQGIGESTVLEFRIGYSEYSYSALRRVAHFAGFRNFELQFAGLLIHSKSDKSSYYDAFRARLVIPISNHEGELVGFAAQQTEESENDKTKPMLPRWLYSSQNTVFKPNKVLFGLYRAKCEMKQNGLVYFVSDLSHVFRFYELSIFNVIGLCGKKFTEFHAESIREYCNRIVLIVEFSNRGAYNEIAEAMIAQGFDVDVCSITNISGTRRLFLDREQFNEIAKKNTKRYIEELITWRYLNQKDSAAREKGFRAIIYVISKIISNDRRNEFIRCASIMTRFDEKTLLEIVTRKRLLQRAVYHHKTEQAIVARRNCKGEFEALRILFQFPGIKLDVIEGNSSLLELLTAYDFTVRPFRELFGCTKCLLSKGIIPTCDELLKVNKGAAITFKKFQRPYRLRELLPFNTGEPGVSQPLLGIVNNFRLKLIQDRIKNLTALNSDRREIVSKIRNLKAIMSDYHSL